MRTTSRPNYMTALENMKNEILNRIKTKFQNFFNKRLVDTGLAVRASEYPFDMGYTGQSNHRRSITKLRSLFVKNLEKNLPYIGFAKEEFFTNGTSDFFTFILKGTPESLDSPELDLKEYRRLGLESTIGSFPSNGKILMRNASSSNRIMNGIRNTTKEFSSLRRYVRYINYLCIKNKVPLALDLEINYRSNSTGTFKFVPSLKIQVLRWISKTSPILVDYLTKMEQGTLTDADFDSDRWSPVELGSLDNCEDINVNASGQEFHLVGIFMNLDKGIQLLNTLSRKVEYGFQAFNFRTA